MQLKLKRIEFGEDYTQGILDLDGRFECYSLEDRDRKLEEGEEKISGSTAISKGTYKIEISESARFKMRTPILLNVPGFTHIRIHPGNKPEDTEGCILVGKNRYPGRAWIGISRKAYNELFDKIDEAIGRKEEVWIEIS